MNDCSNLKELIRELKNNSWDIKTVGEACRELKEGDSKITKSRENDGNCPAIICSDIFQSRGYVDEFKVFVNEKNISSKSFLEKGDLIFARSGYTKKNKDGCRLFLEDFKVLAGNDTYVLKHDNDPYYLHSAITTKSFQRQLERYFKLGMVSVVRIYLKDLKKIKIPLPSIFIQEKIGNFLFKFIEYDKKLNKELENRRKQFHYYKELLFKQGLEKLGWEIRLRN